MERLNRDYKFTTCMRGALLNPEVTLLLLGGVSMNRKANGRKLPKLDYEQVKFNLEEEEWRAASPRLRSVSSLLAILCDIKNYE